jgi:hypothetical protein
MSGNLLEGYRGPESQRLGSVQALLKYMGRNVDQLPGAVLLDNVVLVLSAKGDQYYVVTEKACSCPSFGYRGGPCKHQRKYFPPEYIEDPGMPGIRVKVSKNDIQRIPDGVISDPMLYGYDGPMVV